LEIRNVQKPADNIPGFYKQPEGCFSFWQKSDILTGNHSRNTGSDTGGFVLTAECCIMEKI
jgi:hypothetical protein